jgi:hypothetical protein
MDTSPPDVSNGNRKGAEPWHDFAADIAAAAPRLWLPGFIVRRQRRGGPGDLVSHAPPLRVHSGLKGLLGQAWACVSRGNHYQYSNDKQYMRGQSPDSQK